MIIDCISDLHGHYPKLEGGDLLIVAGDLTARDEPGEYVTKFLPWIAKTKYRKRIVIAGNHDNLLEKGEIPTKVLADFEYLCDSGTEFEGLKIWGSPWSKTFAGMNPHCKAFTKDTEEELAEKWALIPDNIDLLITHSPSYGVLDVVRREVFCGERDEHTGSDSLVKHAAKPNVRLHVFGHIHQQYGKYINPISGKIYVNASYVNERYQPVNKSIRVIL